MFDRHHRAWAREARIAYAIIAMDLDGLVTTWSTGAQHILGWAADEMIGRPASVLFTPEDRARGVPHAEIEAALAQGRSSGEGWHVRRDGTRFWANSEMMPLRGQGRGIYGLVKVLRDQTSQHIAEERQRTDTEFLRGVLAASGDIIKVLDLDGRVQFVNDTGLQALEIGDPEEVRGGSWPAFWSEEGRGEAMAALEAAREGGFGRFQGRADTSGGTPRYWDVQVTPILSPAGRPEKLLAVSRDITATRTAEMALQEALSLNTLILESSRDCIVVLDLEGRVQFVSPGGVAAMEIDDVSALLGQSWLEMWQGGELDAARAALREAGDGRTGRFQGFCPTHKGLAKWWDIAISPLRGTNGQPERLVSIGRDITEAREAQLRLELSEERLQLALGASQMIGIWDFDLLAGTVYGDANFARLHGLDAAEAASGAPITRVLRNIEREDAAALRLQLADLVGGADSLHVEHRLRQQDGSVRWVVGHGRLVRDAAGVPVRLPGAVVDVTEQRENAQRLQLLMEELAHRSKNTLAVVQSIVGQTMRGEGAIAEARLALIARLQALAAAHDVLLQNSWTKAGLRSLVEATARLHAPAPDGGTRLLIEGPDVTLAPHAALSFAMVLHELGTNAVKYGAWSTPAGHVSVRWHVDGVRLHFTWSEHDGPEVRPPSRQGFGSRLIQRSLAADLQASVDHAYLPSGVVLRLEAPLAALQEV